MYWSGAAAAYTRLRRVYGALILMYHSISDPVNAPWVFPRNQMSPHAFERQMRFLSRHRCVISMTQLAEWLEAGRDPNAGTVVITFDDGYVDNLVTAAPILQKYGLPATLFLPTGYVDRGETNWADRLHAAVAFRTRHELDLRHIESDRFELHDERVCQQTERIIGCLLILADRSHREGMLSTIEEQLRPSCRAPRLTMTWDQVRELTNRFSLFEIGGHTVNHIDLQVSDFEIARREIKECKATIERELHQPAQHFSFPYSRSSAESCLMVKEAGFRTAVAAGENVLITTDSPPFALPRVEAPDSLTRLRFVTSGAYPGLSLALTGRS